MQARCRNLAIEGLDGGGPVAGLEVGDVAALISKVPLREFDHAAAAGASARRCLGCSAPAVMSKSSTAAMKWSPVLPVRFGAVFSSCDALEDFVSDHYDRIAGFLDWVADKEEWSVKAFVNLEASSEWAISSDLTLTDEWRRLPESPGTRYFLEKRLKAAARRRAILSSREAAGEICEALLACAIEVVRLPLRGEPGTEKEPVLNLALLVAILSRRRTPDRGRCARFSLPANRGSAWNAADPGLRFTFVRRWIGRRHEAPHLRYPA